MIVETKLGKIEGIEKYSILSGKSYHAFLGIPYAKPPVGEFRFKAPIPVDAWDGILEAKADSNECIQFDIINPTGPKIIGSENCLFLNVFTPEAPTQMAKKKPVMVFIHGGGFYVGSASSKIYSADFLIEKDVILVCMNYRLHILGFLNLNIPSCPGNAGLKDQLLALKWVKENISYFGGDPDNITLFGESAGASAVHLHMISPSAKGLFRKAIIQSGSALSSWAHSLDPEIKAFNIAKELGFEGTNKEDLVEFLRQQPAEKLIQTDQKLQDDLKKKCPGKLSVANFLPSVEKIVDGAFLPDTLENLIKTAPTMPVMNGLNEIEGIIIFLIYKLSLLPILQKDFSSVLKFNFDLNASEVEELTKEIKQEYFGNAEVSLETANILMDLYSDLYFLKFRDSYEFLIKSSEPTYLYEFSFDGKRNMLKVLVEKMIDTNFKGVFHGDELGYLFTTEAYTGNVALDDPKSQERKLIEKMITMWTNFAKTGNPNASICGVEWKPCTADDRCFLRIDSEFTMVQEELGAKRASLWNKWLTKFRPFC